MANETPDPAQFAAAVQGLSDDQLDSAIKDMGTDSVLTAIFDGMQQAFDPSKAQDVEATLQYDIKTDEGTKQWSVVIANGSCSTSEAAANDPRLTLELGIVDFVRLIFNQVQGPQLFMTGKLKLKGDMMFAMQMQNYFKRDFAGTS